MTIILLIISSLLLYSKSKYFPRRFQSHFSWSTKHLVVTRAVGYLCSLLALVLLAQQWDLLTGLVCWFFAQTLVLSTMLMVFPFFDKTSNNAS